MKFKKSFITLLSIVICIVLFAIPVFATDYSYSGNSGGSMGSGGISTTGGYAVYKLDIQDMVGARYSIVTASGTKRGMTIDVFWSNSAYGTNAYNNYKIIRGLKNKLDCKTLLTKDYTLGGTPTSPNQTPTAPYVGAEYCRTGKTSTTQDPIRRFLDSGAGFTVLSVPSETKQLKTNIRAWLENKINNVNTYSNLITLIRKTTNDPRNTLSYLNEGDTLLIEPLFLANVQNDGYACWTIAEFGLFSNIVCQGSTPKGSDNKGCFGFIASRTNGTFPTWVYEDTKTQFWNTSLDLSATIKNGKDLINRGYGVNTLTTEEITAKATVTVKKDGANWTDATRKNSNTIWTNNTCRIHLHKGTTYKYTLVSDGSTQATYSNSEVAVGTYNIYAYSLKQAKYVDTGTDITITQNGASAVINYYTLALGKTTGISSVAGNGICIQNENVNITATATTGYHFTHWLNDTTTYTSNPYTVKMNAKKTFTAYATTYNLKVYYNANGGNVNTNDNYYMDTSTKNLHWKSSNNRYYQNFPYNTARALARYGAFQLYRTGYTFSGWNTKADGTGTTYMDGSTGTTYLPTTLNSAVVHSDCELTLYAKWTPNHLDVYYSANGGSINSDTYYLSNNIVYRKETSEKLYERFTYNTPRDLYNASTFGIYKPGYIFAGWNAYVSGTGTNYDQTTEYKPDTLNADIRAKNCTKTLYAKWIPKVAIYYNANNGAVTSSTYQIKTNSQYIIKKGSAYSALESVNKTWDNIDPTTLPHTPKTAATLGLSRPGYTFSGWKKMIKCCGESNWTDLDRAVNLSNINSYYNGCSSDVKENCDYICVCYKAQWTPNELSVYYNANGGTPSNTTIGENFYYNKLVSSTDKRMIHSINSATTTACCQKWTYNIANENGLVNASSFGLTRTGYTFAGWNTNAAGTGTTFDESTAYTPTQLNSAIKNGDCELILYAKWVPITYTVKYNANEGTGTTASSTHTYDVAKTLTANGFSRTGYAFVNWNTKADGSGTTYTNKQSVKNLSSTQGATVNLYAQWEPNVLSVHYNANNGSISSSKSNTYYLNNKDIYNVSNSSKSTSSFVYNTARDFVNASSFGLYRTGYTFTGWNTKNDGTGTMYDESTQYLPSDVNPAIKNGDCELTLYATWIPNTYTITYKWTDDGSTISGLSPTSYTYGTGTTLPNIPSCTDYTVTNQGSNTWYTSQNDTTTTSSVGSSATGNKVFWAKRTPESHEPIKYSVEYYLDNNTTPIEVQNCIYDSTYTYSSLPDVPIGYNVSGWTDENNVSFTPGTSFKNLASENGAVIKRYAKSGLIQYKVNYYLDGNLLTDLTQIVTYNETGIYRKLPTKQDYYVLGWYKSSTYDPTKTNADYSPDSLFINLASEDKAVISLYAFSTTGYTIEYYIDGQFVCKDKQIRLEGWTYKNSHLLCDMARIYASSITEWYDDANPSTRTNVYTSGSKVDPSAFKLGNTIRRYAWSQTLNFGYIANKGKIASTNAYYKINTDEYIITKDSKSNYIDETSTYPYKTYEAEVLELQKPGYAFMYWAIRIDAITYGGEKIQKDLPLHVEGGKYFEEEYAKNSFTQAEYNSIKTFNITFIAQWVFEFYVGYVANEGQIVHDPFLYNQPNDFIINTNGYIVLKDSKNDYLDTSRGYPYRVRHVDEFELKRSGYSFSGWTGRIVATTTTGEKIIKIFGTNIEGSRLIQEEFIRSILTEDQYNNISSIRLFFIAQWKELEPNKVTIKVTKDDVDWIKNDPNNESAIDVWLNTQYPTIIELWQNGTKTKQLTYIKDNIFEASEISSGTYDIKSRNSRGRLSNAGTITVTAYGGHATVKYYTLSLHIGTGVSSANNMYRTLHPITDRMLGLYLSSEIVPILASVKTDYTWEKWVDNVGDDDILEQSPTITMSTRRDYTAIAKANDNEGLYMVRYYVQEPNVLNTYDLAQEHEIKCSKGTVNVLPEKAFKGYIGSKTVYAVAPENESLEDKSKTLNGVDYLNPIQIVAMEKDLNGNYQSYVNYYFDLIPCTLTYVLNGGLYNASTDAYIVPGLRSFSDTKLISPAYENHISHGWYRNDTTGIGWQNFAGTATNSFTVPGDTVLYAAWTTGTEQEKAIDIVANTIYGDVIAGSQITVSATALNNTDTHVTGSNPATATLTVTKADGTSIFTESSEVVIPHNNKNLVYFNVDIPENLVDETLKFTWKITHPTITVSASTTDKETTAKAATYNRGSQTILPDYSIKYDPDYNHNLEAEKTTITICNWDMWTWDIKDGGKFVKLSYSTEPSQSYNASGNETASKASVLYEPKNDKGLKDATDTGWKTRSGYGFSVSSYFNVQDTTNDLTYTLSNGTTVPNLRASLLFPEFNFLADMNKFNDMTINKVKDSSTTDGLGVRHDNLTYSFDLRDNLTKKDADGTWKTDGVKQHYTPMWYKDGLYTPTLKIGGLWSPIGEVKYTIKQAALKDNGAFTTKIRTNDFEILGSLFDDMYTTHEKYEKPTYNNDN